MTRKHDPELLKSARDLINLGLTKADVARKIGMSVSWIFDGQRDGRLPPTQRSSPAVAERITVRKIAAAEMP